MQRRRVLGWSAFYMKITMIGSGYVGLVSGACFADFGHDVICVDKDERKIARIEGIIDSMTPAERAKPEILKASRKRRIAAGAGVSVQEVNQLLNQFEQTQKMMKMVAKGGMQKMMRGMKGMFR